MDFILIKQDSKIIAALKGRITAANYDDLEQRMAPLFNGDTPNIELDCTNLEYLSSSGLRLFYLLQKSVNERKGHLVMKNVNNYIRDIFTMTGFDKDFDIQ